MQIIDHITEKLKATKIKGKTYYKFKHNPIPGTLVGNFTIPGFTSMFFTFILRSDGTHLITNRKAGDYNNLVNFMNCSDDEFIIDWMEDTKIPSEIEVNYEYLSGDETRWDEKFLEACTVSCVNFNTIIGDTLKEKAEGIYDKIVELTDIMIKKQTSGFFWIITNPIIAELLKISSFEPTGNYLPMGETAVVEFGILDKKYKIFIADDFPKHKILIGVNDWETCPGKDTSSINIANFQY